MTCTMRATPVAFARALTRPAARRGLSSGSHGASSSSSSSPWRRLAPATSASRAPRFFPAPPLPTRNPAAFRVFAGGPDGPSGPISDDERTPTRDYASEISWIARADATKEDEEVDPAAQPDVMVMPVFPLGSTAYMPHSDHVLNIFEPRYRQMYSDILFNGSRRFAVPVSDPKSGRLAAVAPIFYLEDLKEVSEQTADAVKYVCSHKVIGRVRIDRTINDKAASDRSTYLKAVVEPMEDGDDDEDLSMREGILSERFATIIQNQTKLQEPVRFTENLIDTLSASRGEDGLWRLAGLWQSLLQNRIGAKESELSNEIQTLLRNYLAKQGTELQNKVAVQFDALPGDVKAEFTRLQTQYREEAASMVSAALYPFALLVQCDTHGARLEVFGEMLEEEEARLRAKLALQSLFSSASAPGGEATEEAEVEGTEDADGKKSDDAGGSESA